MVEPFERVYTVTDYWDGPREGVAAYGGAPHLYRSVWRRDLDDWDDDRYFLCSITPAHAALAFEDWAIWQRFAEYYRGRQAPVPASLADWGALPEDLPRHRQLRQLLAPILAVARDRCFVARAEFRSLGPPREAGLFVPVLEVRWTCADSLPDDDLPPSPAA